MYLVQLIYASEIEQSHFSKGTAQEIQETAKKNNYEQDLSGVLFCDGKYFLQALEGSRSKLSKLYTKIAMDPRHKNVTLLRYQDISIRDFSDWSMELLTYSKNSMEILKRYSIQREFDPYSLSSESSHSLLCQLAFMQSNAKMGKVA